MALPSLVYYLRHRVDTYFEKQALIDALHTNRRVFVVLRERDYEALAPSIGTPTCVIDRFQTFDVKLRAILRREPLPQLVLITNRCLMMTRSGDSVIGLSAEAGDVDRRTRAISISGSGFTGCTA